MPLLSTLTGQQLTGLGITRALPPAEATYVGFSLDAATYDEGDVVTATVSTTNIDNGTTVNYTVTGVSANDLSSGSLTGSITVNSNTGTVSWTLAEDGLTEGTDTFTVTLAATDSAGTSTGVLSDSAAVIDTSNDPANTLWLDDNDNPTTVRQIIGSTSMQINGVFAVNPGVPQAIEGRTSGAQTTIIAITARTATFIEVDDNGNSTSFVVGEQLNLVS